MVPQNIQEYEPPPEGAHKPIILHVENARPNDPWGCYSQPTLESRPFEPSIYVSDDDQVPLTARWFLNYEIDNTDSYKIIAQQTITPQSGNYGFVSLSRDEVGLAGREPGYYSVEVVVSDGFDPDLSALPPNRGVLKSYNLASYKWFIEYRAGECPVQ